MPTFSKNHLIRTLLTLVIISAMNESNLITLCSFVATILGQAPIKLL